MAALFWQYVFYGFCGFLLEVTLAKTIHSPKQDRKCHLFLPVCPVYGVGALAILFLSPALNASPLLLFLGGAVAATAVEWGFSLFYEKAAGVAFWDYSALPLNVGGRVCLLFSFFWGLLALLLQWVHPWVALLVDHIPPWAIWPAVLVLSADTLCTILLLRQTRDTASLRWYDRKTYRKVA